VIILVFLSAPVELRRERNAWLTAAVNGSSQNEGSTAGGVSPGSSRGIENLFGADAMFGLEHLAGNAVLHTSPVSHPEAHGPASCAQPRTTRQIRAISRPRTIEASAERSQIIDLQRTDPTTTRPANHARGLGGPTSPLTRARIMRAREDRDEWPADQVERWPIDRLIPYAKNSRTHSEAQIAQLVASMKEWGRR